jgi:hypothetical protein
MLLKPKLVTMTSQVYKRYQHLYSKAPGKNTTAESKMFYKYFK